MWSGPRNLSTALMRSWENRIDASVVDEPFYACFLVNSGLTHPMQKEILASQAHDWQQVITQQLSKPLDNDEHIQYQKQMTHHIVAPLNQNWFASVKHAFLIRHPHGVVASYRHKRDSLMETDLGFAKQVHLHRDAQQLGQTPPIIDADDLLQNPEAYLRALCAALEVDFDPSMLHWPAGLRESDGAWAAHWYNNVATSTGFTEYKKPQIELSKHQKLIADECLPYYQQLYDRRIRL